MKNNTNIEYNSKKGIIMSCLSSSKRERIIAQIERIDTLLTASYTAFEAAAGTEVKKYRFDSAEASQMAEVRDLDEMLDNIDRLEKRKDSLIRRLNGTGIVNMNMRRKNYRGQYPI